MSKQLDSTVPLTDERWCYHCGTENPRQVRWQTTLNGEARTFCCAGCLAVAQTIHAAGLAAFYAARTAVAQPAGASPEDAAPSDEWVVYDDENVTRDFVFARPDGSREIALLLDGMTCGACVWLIESWLMKQPGVGGAQGNFASRRMVLVWQPEIAPLSTLLRAVARIGYQAHPYDPSRRDAQAKRERRALLFRLGVALFGMMQVMMLALPGYLSDDVTASDRALLHWASLVLTLPVLLYSALPFFRGAWRDLSIRRPGMDVPVALGLLVAFIASVTATVRGVGDVYYDSVTMFVALLLVARYVEAAARQRSGEAIEAMARQRPLLAERLADWPRSSLTEAVPASALKSGEWALVRAGAVVPADGVVESGVSHIEEAVLTGESWPVRREAGDKVFAGAVNRESALVVRVTAVGEATRLATVLRLVDRAAAARPRVARLADRVAFWFVGALLALTAVIGALWWWFMPAQALAVVFALLVVSCPCALSLATPTALSAAAGALGRLRVVLARSDALETLARVTLVVFDKTGTLTTGRVTLTAMAAAEGEDAEALLRVAQTLEAPSEHPLAAAFRTAKTEAAPLPPASALTIVPGMGIDGEIAGRRWRIGRAAFIGGEIPETLERFAAGRLAGESVVFLGEEGRIRAVFALGDALRPGAREVVAELHAMGIRTALLSGDRQENVAGMAETLGIGIAQGGLLPEDKRRCILDWQAQNEVVAMVGDGVNDAPGLAQAQISISLGSATSLAQWTADVVILSDELCRLTDALHHARRTLRVIRQNLGWALAYNVVAIPAAALGWVTPLLAAAGMSASSLAVVLNALRVSRLLRKSNSISETSGSDLMTATVAQLRR